jgi:DNA-binding transcriptional LysR family regulator
VASIPSIATLNLDQLLAFERVVRTGSFSRAALELGVGQPAVSSRIQALERTLGGALFRRGRRVTVTVLGATLTPYVRRAIEVLSEGVAAARSSQEGRRGRVTLGALPSLTGPLVAPALGRLFAEQPGVECLVKAAEHEAVLSQLLDGLIELALIAWPCPPALEPDLSALFVLREPVLLVVHRDHVLAKKKHVRKRDVVELARPLYRLRWWPVHHPAIEELVARSGSSLELPLEAALELVGVGNGAGFFPRGLIARSLAERTLVAVRVGDLREVTRETALVRRLRPLPLSPVAARLVTLLREEARSVGVISGRVTAKHPS